MPTSPRIDAAFVRIRAPAAQVYLAFASGPAMVAWLPPEGMVGHLHAFDFRAGGGFRMRLVYLQPGPGKTSADADEVTVRFVRLVPNARIEQAVRFESEDPAYAGEMRMTWTLDAAGTGTRVTVRCEDVPAGIDAADHQAGLRATLAQLAAWVERGQPA